MNFPLFIEGNLKGKIYAGLIEKSVEPLTFLELGNQIDANGNLSLADSLLHLEQYGASSHYVR